MSFKYRLSGIISGVEIDYTFPQNPNSNDIITPKAKHTILQTLVGENIYQRTLRDNAVRKMDWDISTYEIYSGLKRFASRDENGNIYPVRFWDGTVYEFQGNYIEVIDVYGEPQPGETNRWKIELQFKWIY